MADDDLNQRLQTLSQLLGKQISIVEIADDTLEQREHEPVTQEHALPTDMEPWEPHPEPVADDAPKKFLNHDAGPRPDTEGAFDPERFVKGKPSKDDIDLCPWNVVMNYPSSFIGKTNRPHVEPYFEKIFEGRVWDFFYLYHPTKPAEKPYLFVPTSQFQLFLDQINEELKISLSIPASVNADRFFLRFTNDFAQPRYLRRSSEGEDIDDGSAWPDPDEHDAHIFRTSTPVQQADFERKLRLVNAPKAKDRKKGESRTAERRADRQHMLTTTQQLLGLKPGNPVGIKGDQPVVFVAIDVEALERRPNPVSEVGVAILDAKDIQDIPRGICGQNWWPMIVSHHLRTKEYSGLCNFEFTKGCPDAFDFGTSTFPTKQQMPAAILDIIQPLIDAKRELILVGHDTQQDVQYLASIGLDMHAMKCVARMLDSQALHQAWRDRDQGRGLSSVLAELGISNRNLHNAGNDAVFTLRALIGVAIEQIREESATAEGSEYTPELWGTDLP